MGETGWKGIFAVLQTPLTEADTIDMDVMARQVEFSIECGSHGLVYPVLGGEFQYLTETERTEALKVVCDVTKKRIPVVAGVAAPSRAVAAELAKSAAEAGADSLVALPPYISPASLDQVMDYFRAIADASGLPIMVQHARIVPLPPPFLVRLLTEIEEVKYIKEEREPSAHNLTQVINDVGDACLGIFGGGHGRWMMGEMERGSSGFMPAVQTLDLYVRTWDAFQAGDRDEARRLYNLHLPLINQLIMVGLQVCKEVLVRRGVFENNLMRAPGGVQMDEGDHRELDAVMAGLKLELRDIGN
jgi:dihydrodipicolinate synthase/N-acetylneuraminate lyase